MQDDLVRLVAGRRGHFRMESGYHSELWFDLSGLFNEPTRVEPMARALAHQLAAHRIDAVCGPVTGGALLAEMVAAELKIPSVIAERIAPGAQAGLFPVSYRVVDAQRAGARGKRIAIVDDAISAGSAVRGTHADLVALGAHPVALGALLMFGEAILPFAAANQLAVEAMARLPFGMWKPTECPLCRAQEPLENVSDAPPSSSVPRGS
jgi:orotate phosphoribosyltransferase